MNTINLIRKTPFPHSVFPNDKAVLYMHGFSCEFRIPTIITQDEQELVASVQLVGRHDDRLLTHGRHLPLLQGKIVIHHTFVSAQHSHQRAVELWLRI